MQMKSRKNINFEYHKNENKPVIVFSNSLGCDLSMWDIQFNELKKDFAILRYDVRGHGNSVPFASSDFTINDLALDLVDLLDELEIKKANYCGLSIGGFIGMYLALNYADHFSSFTLCNTAPKIGTVDGWHSRIELVQNEGLGTVAAASPARWFKDDFVIKHPEIVSQVTSSMRKMEKECYIGCCQILASNDFREEIKNINLPTLIIAGSSDQVTTVKEASEMQKQIAGSKLVVLDGAHLSNIEDKSFSAHLAQFIKDNH